MVIYFLWNKKGRRKMHIFVLFACLSDGTTPGHEIEQEMIFEPLGKYVCCNTKKILKGTLNLSSIQ